MVISAEECVICMSDIRMDIRDTTMLLTTYMMTPCKHKFHEICLTNWTKIKMECPTCRRVLPLITSTTDIEEY